MPGPLQPLVSWTDCKSCYTRYNYISTASARMPAGRHASSFSRTQQVRKGIAQSTGLDRHNGTAATCTQSLVDHTRSRTNDLRVRVMWITKAAPLQPTPTLHRGGCCAASDSSPELGCTPALAVESVDDYMKIHALLPPHHALQSMMNYSITKIACSLHTPRAPEGQ